jgi:predicted nucleic acid-binding Zn ribbon protein
VKQHFDDPAPEVCPAGHRRIQRVFSTPTIVFKGPGFYTTDNGGCSSTAKRTKKSDGASNQAD